MFYVYILYSKKYSKSYVGLTGDLEKRLFEHNSKKSNYTANYVPWEIIYSEVLNTREEARTREKYLKSASGRRWMKKNVKWPRGATE